MYAIVWEQAWKCTFRVRREKLLRNCSGSSWKLARREPRRVRDGCDIRWTLTLPITHIDIDIVCIVIVSSRKKQQQQQQHTPIQQEQQQEQQQQKEKKTNEPPRKKKKKKEKRNPCLLQSATDIYRILFQLDAPKEAGVFKSNNFVGGRGSSTRYLCDRLI